jgi:hypothetical protein
MKLATLLLIAATAKASLVFELNSISYYSPDAVVGKVHLDSATIPVTEATPITYLSLSEADVSANSLNSTIAQYLANDDVFSESFLKTLVLGGPGSLSADAMKYLKTIGCGNLLGKTVNGLMSGPYLLHPSGAVSKVYRLYWE